jgi:hypothetical protein
MRIFTLPSKIIRWLLEDWCDAMDLARLDSATAPCIDRHAFQYHWKDRKVIISDHVLQKGNPWQWCLHRDLRPTQIILTQYASTLHRDLMMRLKWTAVENLFIEKMTSRNAIITMRVKLNADKARLKKIVVDNSNMPKHLTINVFRVLFTEDLVPIDGSQLEYVKHSLSSTTALSRKDKFAPNPTRFPVLQYFEIWTDTPNQTNAMIDFGRKLPSIKTMHIYAIDNKSILMQEFHLANGSFQSILRAWNTEWKPSMKRSIKHADKIWLDWEIMHIIKKEGVDIIQNKEVIEGDSPPAPIGGTTYCSLTQLYYLGC